MRRRGEAASAEIAPAAGRPTRRVRVSRLGADDGMTLVELMIALTILSFGLLALASVATAGLLSLRDSSLRQEATEAAAEVLELARDTSWADLANLTGDPLATAATFDPDGPGCLAAEAVIRSASGPVTGAPYQVGPATPVPGELTVRTYVTDVVALDCPAAPAAPTAPPAPARRVTVLAQWLSADTIHESRKSTMIAMSGGRTGQFAFDVTPLTASTALPPGLLCLRHDLTNLGLADAYQIEAPPTLPPSVPFTAYADVNNDGVGDPAELITLSTPLVAGGDTLPLLFCYEIDTVNVTYNTTVGVRSFRDSSLIELVSNTVQTIDTLTLYLHTEDNQGVRTRDVSDIAASTLDMDRVFPAAVPSPPAGAPPASQGVMFDYDLGVTASVGGVNLPIDPGGYQGMALPRVPVDPLPTPLPLTGDLNEYDSPYHGRWHYQVPYNYTVFGTGTITAWLAPTSALLIPALPLLPPAPVPYGLRHRLVHLDAHGNVLGVLAESPPTPVPGVKGVSPIYVHNEWGWQRTSWTYTVTTLTVVSKHDYLRLELVCDLLLSNQTCHVGHDTPARDANIQVPLR